MTLEVFTNRALAPRTTCTWEMMLLRGGFCFCGRTPSTALRDLSHSLSTSVKPVGSNCLYPHFADGKQKGNLTCPRSHSRSAMKPVRASKLSASKAFPQSAFRFMRSHGCFNSRLGLLRFYQSMYQKRNTKLTFVSSHLKDFELSLFQRNPSSIATAGEERGKE